MTTYSRYLNSRPKLTPRQRDEIRDRYAAGETLASLAVEFGVAAATLRHYVTARGTR